MKSVIKVSTLTIAMLLALSVAAQAGIGEVGVGVRATGMGMAQAGAANDHSAVEYNPAALVVGRERYDLSGFSAMVSIGRAEYTTHLTLNGVDQEYPFSSYMIIGALVPIGKRITVGVNLVNNNDWFLATTLAGGPRFTRFTPTQSPSGTYGFGLKITDKFSVGYAGITNLNFNFSTLDVDLNALLAGLGLSLGEPVVNMNPYMEIDVISTSSYIVGALYRPFKWASLGFSYKYFNPTKTIIPIHIPGGLLPDTTIKYVSETSSPTRLIFGVGIFPNEHLTLAADLAYDRWSKTTQESQFISSDPSFLNIPMPVYELKNVFSPRVGIEYKGNMRGKLSRADYALRGGYNFYPSPYPAMPKGSAKIDSDSHSYSAGISLGYKPKKALGYVALDYFWEYIDLVERSHRDLARNPPLIISDGYVIYTGFALTIKI